MTKIVVEIFAKRNSKSTAQYHFDIDSKLLIGRSYECDLIIDDPYISPQHMEIIFNETIEIKDLSSENGTSIKGLRLSNDHAEIKSGDKITIGHTDIRVYLANHAIAPTKKMGWSTSLRGLFHNIIVSGVLFFLCVLVGIFTDWVISSDKDFFTDGVYKTVLACFMIVLAVSCSIYFFSFFTKHRIKFSAAVSYSAFFWALFLPLSVVSNFWMAPLLAYEVSLVLPLVILSLGGVFCILFITYVENGVLVFRDYTSSLFLVAVILFSGLYDHFVPDDYNKLIPHYESSMPIFGWEPENTISIESFLQNSRALK